MLYDILNCHCIFHDILQNISFCSYSSLVCPTAPSYSPPAGPPEMGSELFLSLRLIFLCCDERDNQFQKDKSNFLFRSGGMYISTAITYQTHIEAGQGRGRSVEDDDDCGDGGDDYYHLRKERVSCYAENNHLSKGTQRWHGELGCQPTARGSGGRREKRSSSPSSLPSSSPSSSYIFTINTIISIFTPTER